MISVHVTGAPAVHEMLRDYMEPVLPQRLQKAMDEGAKVFVPPLKAEASRVSKRMARAVSRKRGKRDRPSTVVVFNRRRAFFAHFVIGGTKDHGPRSADRLAWQGKSGPIFARRVRGVQANPMVERVARRYEPQSYAAIDRSLDATEAT